MNRHGYKYCPPKRKPKKKPDHKKLGAAMLLLGVVTVLAFLLPIKCWVILLAATLMICGILVMKR